MQEEKNQPPAQPEAPKAEPAPAPAPAPEAPKAPAPEAPKPIKKEVPANCEGCNKVIRKKQHYYRNGKYFCSKRCWKKSSKKAETKEAQPETR